MTTAAAPTIDRRGDSLVLLTHDRLLGRRLFFHTRIRYMIAATMVVGTVIASRLVGIDGLDFRWLTAPALAIVVYNTVFLVLVLPRQDPAAIARHDRFLRGLLLASVLVDYIALTLMIWLLGGIRSPFLCFYLFHLVITSFLLSRRSVVLSTITAILCLGGLAAVETTGLLPPRLPTGLFPAGGTVEGRYVVTILVIYSGLFVLTSALLTSLFAVLRDVERVNRERADEVERLSTMRREFLLVAVHDINAPVGLVTLLLRNMREGVCGPLSAQQEEQIERVLSNLEGLEVLLSELRTLAQIDSSDIAEQGEPVPIAQIVDEVLQSYADHAQERNQTMRVEASTGTPHVRGVPTLLRQAIANYLANAIKYTPPGGSIVVRIGEHAGLVRVEVEDDGIGISPSDQNRLFREFVRVGRDHPHAREIKGTGLGLSLVRAIVEAHGGGVGLRSAPGEGSTFWLEIPPCAPPTGTASE